MARKYPAADVKILYAKAAGICAFPACRKVLILEGGPDDKDKQIGKIAHIVAHSPNGPRADAKFKKDKLDTYENWILLCPTCHDVVDARESKYTVQELLNIKAEHEIWVSEQLDERMSEVSFAELEVAAKAIASGQHLGSTDFHIITPEEKIQKNALTQAVRALILEGLSRSFEVSSYLTKAAQLDEKFPDRLTAGFKDKYLELKNSFSGDALFWVLLEFAQAGKRDFKQQAASLAILSHLFHLCEIFEK